MSSATYGSILAELCKLDKLARQSVSNGESVNMAEFTASLDKITECLKLEVKENDE